MGLEIESPFESCKPRDGDPRTAEYDIDDVDWTIESGSSCGIDTYSAYLTLYGMFDHYICPEFLNAVITCARFGQVQAYHNELTLPPVMGRPICPRCLVAVSDCVDQQFGTRKRGQRRASRRAFGRGVCM